MLDVASSHTSENGRNQSSHHVIALISDHGRNQSSHHVTALISDHGRNQSSHHVGRAQHLDLTMEGTNPLTMSEGLNTYI